VAYQYGCACSGGDLARAIYGVLESHLKESMWGMYHLCQPEPTTWFGFADAIFDEARKQGVVLKVSTLNAILTSDFLTSSKRPVNSVMAFSKFSQTFNLSIKPWAESLAGIVKELKGV